MALAQSNRTHCKHGHEFTPENTYKRKDRPGERICLTCKLERWKWKLRPIETRKRQRAANPEKNKARAALRDRVHRGEIKRQSCEVCGDPDTHGHHDDYSKPLEVRWLCRTHHEELHHGKRGLGEKAGEIAGEVAIARPEGNSRA